MKFTLNKSAGAARLGTLSLRRGDVPTPAFMPVGTYGTVKGVTPEEVAESGADILLGNTFHLMLRPGTRIIRSILKQASASKCFSTFLLRFSSSSKFPLQGMGVLSL